MYSSNSHPLPLMLIDLSLSSLVVGYLLPAGSGKVRVIGSQNFGYIPKEAMLSTRGERGRGSAPVTSDVSGHQPTAILGSCLGRSCFNVPA